MKKTIILAAEKIHKLVFGHPMSTEMRSFLANLSWSFVTGVVVLPLMMIITTLAGRLIGPTEYGKYSLLLLVNQFLTIFIFFGLDTTSVKYIAKAKSHQEKKKVIATITSFIFKVLLLLIGLTLISLPFVMSFAKSYTVFLLLLSYYTVVVSIKVIFDLVIRGIEQFKAQAFGRIMEVIVVLASFLIIIILCKLKNFLGLLLVLNCGGIAISIYYYSKLSKYLGKSDKAVLKHQLNEGKLFFISAILGTLYLSIDRLVVAKYLGLATFGIYSAYYFASFGVVSQLTLLFTNVLFPVTSRLKDKKFAKKIDQLLIYGSIPLVIFFIIMMAVMLLIFGREYPMNFWYMLGFSIFSMLYFFQALYNTVIADVDRKEYGKYLLARNIISVCTVVLYVIVIFIHKVTIPIILLILIINLITAIIVERLFIRAMQRK